MMARFLGASFIALFLAGCAPRQVPFQMGDPEWGMDVTWHGHSCFTLRDSVGRTIVIDPFDETVGYGRLQLRGDALFVTHNHFDHNFTRAVKARLREIELVESTGTVSVASGFSVTGIPSAHDAEDGEIHGPNTIFSFVMGGMRVVHLGDFGEARIRETQRPLISPVDVLFIPVGGVTTLDAKAAKKIVDELKPGAVFPMHYGNIRFYKLNEIERFTELFKREQVKRLEKSTVRIRRSDLLAEPVVYVLKSTERNY